MSKKQEANLEPKVFWESLSASEVIDKLKSSENGLSSEAVALKREEFGENKLPEAKTDSALKRFFSSIP